mmetsp:Transcript_102757/g.286185  ORF Transcript_102757/g.286185 Transcript_102757/m.286185 type:complete len:204 (-) Transcript_102757:91-702(-)
MSAQPSAEPPNDAGIVAVGTLNEGKHEACRQCFAEYPDVAYTVRGVKADSGVSDQPMGLDETVLGAKNRAEAALRSVDGARIGIGLESGLVIVGGTHFDFCACSIYSGGRHCVGMSSMWALPPKVAETFAERGYNQAFADLGFDPDPNGKGMLGKLTGGVLSRPAQMKESVHAAMIQLRNARLYPLRGGGVAPPLKKQRGEQD